MTAIELAQYSVETYAKFRNSRELAQSQREALVLSEALLSLASENQRLKSERTTDDVVMEQHNMTIDRLLGDVERMRQMLTWLDEGGGLGADVHKRIRDLLAPPLSGPGVR